MVRKQNDENGRVAVLFEDDEFILIRPQHNDAIFVNSGLEATQISLSQAHHSQINFSLQNMELFFKLAAHFQSGTEDIRPCSRNQHPERNCFDDGTRSLSIEPFTMESFSTMRTSNAFCRSVYREQHTPYDGHATMFGCMGSTTYLAATASVAAGAACLATAYSGIMLPFTFSVCGSFAGILSASTYSVTSRYESCRNSATETALRVEDCNQQNGNPPGNSSAPIVESTSHLFVWLEQMEEECKQEVITIRDSHGNEQEGRGQIHCSLRP